MQTRLHSSRMRTAHVLTVSHSMLCTRGVYLVPGGVPDPRGCTWSRGVDLVQGGVPGPRGCTWSQRRCTWSQGGVPGLGGCTWSRREGVPGLGGVPSPRGWCQVLPPVNRMTNKCKNITLPQTSFAGSN